MPYLSAAPGPDYSPSPPASRLGPASLGGGGGLHQKYRPAGRRRQAGGSRGGEGMVDIVTESGLIDDILGPHQKDLGVGYNGYRNHCFRMLNVGRFLVPDEPYRDDRFAIMAAFHDLPFFLTGNLDYLGKASDLAKDYLT